MTRLLPQDRKILGALGLRIRDARERREISAELMAQRLDVPLETVHRLEAGDSSLTIALLYRALRLMRIEEDFDYLAQDAEMLAKLLLNW